MISRPEAPICQPPTPVQGGAQGWSRTLRLPSWPVPSAAHPTGPTPAAQRECGQPWWAEPCGVKLPLAGGERTPGLGHGLSPQPRGNHRPSGAALPTAPTHLLHALLDLLGVPSSPGALRGEQEPPDLGLTGAPALTAEPGQPLPVSPAPGLCVPFWVPA